jgi:hypothetical protein
MQPILINKPKVEAITTLHANKESPAVQSLLSLLDILIQESREDIDDAEEKDFLAIKAGIATLKNLRDIILRGLPGQTKPQ